LTYFPPIFYHIRSRDPAALLSIPIRTQKDSHWLAIHFEPKSSSAFYFDAYGISLIIPAIQTFLRRNCIVWNHSTVQLQGLTSTVCGQYCCLFTLYMDRGYTPKQFIGFFTADIADRQVNKIFTSEFRPLRKELRGGQCSNNIYKRYATINKFIIVTYIVDLNGGGN
jgi:hypothetical protein